MITFETTIQDHLVRMYGDFPLKNAAGAILKTLAQISTKTDIFNGRFVMCFGWAYFFLDERQEDDGTKFWVVQTSDYKKNPLKDRSDNVTVSLLVQNMQVEAVQKSKSQPEAVTFKDTILVLKSALNAKEIYLNRTEPTKDGDSGWYLGILDDPDEENHTSDEYEKIPSYRFLESRAEVLRVLQMPVGTVAVITDNKLTALIDKDDQPLEFTSEEERKRLGAEARKKMEQEMAEAQARAEQEAAQAKQVIETEKSEDSEEAKEIKETGNSEE